MQLRTIIVIGNFHPGNRVDNTILDAQLQSFSADACYAFYVRICASAMFDVSDINADNNVSNIYVYEIH